MYFLTILCSASPACEPSSRLEPPSSALSQPFNKPDSQLTRDQANQSNSGKQVWEGLWIQRRRPPPCPPRPPGWRLAAEDVSHSHQSGSGTERDRQRCIRRGKFLLKDGQGTGLSQARRQNVHFISGKVRERTGPGPVPSGSGKAHKSASQGTILIH